jgi:WD40 repeat protein
MRRQQTLEGHSNGVWSVAFSRDSKLLASASGDKTVKVWDAATGTLQQTVIVENYVLNLSFDVTDSILVTNIGYIKVDRTGIPPLPISSQEVSGKIDRERLGISGSWVTWNGQNLLWLPPGFRARTSDVSLTGLILAIGCQSGKVFIIEISLDILRSYYS